MVLPESSGRLKMKNTVRTDLFLESVAFIMCLVSRDGIIVVCNRTFDNHVQPF